MPALPTGEQLVTTFRSYEYVPYEWGGYTPNTGWDCSGACNWITGAIYHLLIPGFLPGTFGYNSGHGPVVADWINFGGVTRGWFGAVQPLPGDLIAWGPNQHIGMAFSATRFVSAANPSAGTIEADIGSFFNYTPYVLRIRQVSLTGGTPIGIPSPTPLPANPLTNWAATISLTSGRTERAASNLSSFASVIRRT
jgi:cell wall-associated NlpC family hydrolase